MAKSTEKPTKKIVPAPSKLSAALLMACEDLLRVSEKPGYSILMSSWHKPACDWNTDDVTCYVCFSGAVMAGRLRAPRNANKTPASYHWRWGRVLCALNEAREARVGAALMYMDVETVHVMTLDRVARWSRDTFRPYRTREDLGPFLHGMRMLARELQEYGL